MYKSSGKRGPKDQVALQYYTTTILRLRIGARLTRYRNCKFHNFARTISRHADGISRYSVPPSAGPLLPLYKSILSTCQRKNCKKLPRQLPRLPQRIRTYPCIQQTHIFSQPAVGCERRKISTIVATRGVMTRLLESSKIVFFARALPRTPLGELNYDAPPDPTSRLGMVTPLPIPLPLDALGVSNSTPLTSLVRRSPCAPTQFL